MSARTKVTITITVEHLDDEVFTESCTEVFTLDEATSDELSWTWRFAVHLRSLVNRMFDSRAVSAVTQHFQSLNRV